MSEPDVCPAHSTGTKVHECPEWDFMVICEQCPEFECCSCWPSADEPDFNDSYYWGGE
jgi:hypothetical protein